MDRRTARLTVRLDKILGREARVLHMPQPLVTDARPRKEKKKSIEMGVEWMTNGLSDAEIKKKIAALHPKLVKCTMENQLIRKNIAKRSKALDPQSRNTVPYFQTVLGTAHASSQDLDCQGTRKGRYRHVAKISVVPVSVANLPTKRLKPFVSLTTPLDDERRSQTPSRLLPSICSVSFGITTGRDSTETSSVLPGLTQGDYRRLYRDITSHKAMSGLCHDNIGLLHFGDAEMKRFAAEIPNQSGHTVGMPHEGIYLI